MIKGENKDMVYFNKSLKKPVGTRFEGEYEADILCQDCEQHLNQYDNYGAEVIHGFGLKEKLGFIEHLDPRGILFNVLVHNAGYDYKKFKLFSLSLIWRASISTRHFFEKFALEEVINEDLRKKILNQEPGNESEYPFLITLPPLVQNETGERGFRVEDTLFTSNILKIPTKINTYHFFILGTEYIFIPLKNITEAFFYSIQHDKLMLPFRTRERQNEIWQGITKTVNSI